MLGRTRFLARYGFVKSRDILVRNPRNDDRCDAGAILGAAYGNQFPDEGPLKPKDLLGSGMAIEPKLQKLGFEVLRIGEDWSVEEVQATVDSYFEMLNLEAQTVKYKKSVFNAALRSRLNERSKASIELKHQNISAVLHALELPFIPGYKPRSNSQLLLRKKVHQYILDHPAAVEKIADVMEEWKSNGEKTFTATVVEAPVLETIHGKTSGIRMRLPRRIDFAARDEANRHLGRAGEQWAINFEHQRLTLDGNPELFQRLDWVSDRLGDGAGYDILSYETSSSPRYIEVKTTNGPYKSSFIISHNEMDFAKEVGDAFYLYRIFRFREMPTLYMLRGDISRQLHLDPIDFRASFTRIAR
ncbi:DUF3883 domain-containing protein [Xylophilus sp. Kf1]|nr:DUF3883 domain-containing protein [Xylophilus sp. Kf1]